MSWAKGKIVLVTGGSQGIGHATAVAFRNAGATVHITGTRDAAADYEDDLSGFTYHRVAMGEADKRAALAAAIPALDVLVNNAGMGAPDEYTLEGFSRVIEVNLTAVMDLCLRFHPALAAAKGAVINVGSLSSFLAIKDQPAYTTSKTAILGLTRALGDKWSADGVRVNMVAPGFIETRMTGRARENPDVEKRLLKAIPMQRWGQPAEIADAILFLASPAASYITGQSLAIDGGLLLR
ncbi:SDR family NAD(P)-dependent oxidoreductase [Sphingoaurantiacus capsulatus]|uniref:SDR family NAD(P)-dependent oxidoreductase n=1 Tax=Sphingoaurantiacus capsulatus TaxID=1771310 RepID=A0ABV7XBU7_9SPHN